MAEWTNIPDDVLEPGKPIRSVDAIALRDNPVAIAEGAAGAPRIEDAALDTNVTNAGREWVMNRTAAAPVGAVGTYAFLIGLVATGVITAGNTYSGSNLRYFGYVSGIGVDATGSAAFGATPDGTWRAMGTVTTVGTIARNTLFLRIA